MANLMKAKVADSAQACFATGYGGHEMGTGRKQEQRVLCRREQRRELAARKKKGIISQNVICNNRISAVHWFLRVKPTKP